MAFVNNNQPQYDLPQWYPMASLPVASVAGSASCTADDGSDPCLYYVSGVNFYRHSTVTNGWQQLASLPTAPVTSVALKYSKYAGYRGNCLGATANTITIAPINPNALAGKTIRIMSGKGMGQERTITSGGNLEVMDKGLITGVNAVFMQDTTKKWIINEHVGSQVRITYGVGQATVRKVLYNNENTLYFFDVNYQQLEAWQNTSLYTATPYTLPIVTASLQAHYSIEKSTATIDTPWDVIPDWTSSFCVLVGGIFAITASATAPFATIYYYDLHSDTWTTKTSLGGLLPSALAGDWSVERAGEISGAFCSGTATSATSLTLTNTSKNMPTDRFVNYQLRITGGTGVGQRMRIIGNNATMLTVEKQFKITPDNTSTYSIFGNTNVMYLSGNNQSSLYQYLVEEDIWSLSQTYGAGIAKNGSATFGGQEGIGITSIAKNNNGIISLNSIPTAGGANYSIGDILTISTGGTLGKARVLGTTSTGSVTEVMLYGCGLNYTIGASKATTGGTGTGCTLEISTVGTVGRVTTAMYHNLTIGDSFACAGATDSAWNVTTNVLGCDALNMFDISTTATANWVALASQGTTSLVDCTANWIPNEHVGRLVTITIAGSSPTTQVRRITANTQTTLTLNSAITTAVNGTSRYVISEPYTHGRAVQCPADNKGGVSYATSGTTTTLVDSTKEWIPGQWVGYKFRIQSGTGLGNEVTITANTKDTLTFATQSFSPDVTTKYLIMDSFGVATAGTTTSLTDTTKKWAVNQWAGKRCKIMSGTGAGQEFVITSNTVNALAFGAITAPDTSSCYCILEAQIRGVGSALNWVFANTDPTHLTQGKYLIGFFGAGTNLFGRYDITTELWEITQTTCPQGEMFTIGSSFAYSGKDRLYFQVNSTGRFGYIDVNTLISYVGTQLYQAPLGAGVVGNRLDIITTAQGTDIAILLDNSGLRMWRTFILY